MLEGLCWKDSVEKHCVGRTVLEELWLCLRRAVLADCVGRAVDRSLSYKGCVGTLCWKGCGRECAFIEKNPSPMLLQKNASLFIIHNCISQLNICSPV